MVTFRWFAAGQFRTGSADARVSAESTLATYPDPTRYIPLLYVKFNVYIFLKSRFNVSFILVAQGIVQNQNMQNLTQIVSTSNALKRPQDNIQPKMTVSRSLTNILPSNATAIRPGSGSSVSTQTTPAIVSQIVQKAQVTFVWRDHPSGENPKTSSLYRG